MWRRLLFLIVSAAAFVALSDSYIRSAHFGALARRAILHLASHRAACNLALGPVQAQLIPPALRIQQAQFTCSTEATSFAGTCAHAWLQPRLWPSARGTFALHYLVLDGLRLEVTSPATAAPSQPHRKRGGLPLDINHLMLRRGQLTVGREPQAWQAAGIEIDLVAPKWGGRDIAWRIDTLRPGLPTNLPAGLAAVVGRLLDIAPMAGAAPLKGEGLLHLEGSLDAPGHVRIRRSTLHIGALKATLSGELQAQAPYDFVLQVGAEGPLAELQNVAPLRQPLAGGLRAQARCTGGGQAIEIEGEFGISSLVLRGAPVGDLQVRANWRRGALSVESLRLTQPPAGVITASGRLDSQDPHLPVRLAARLHDVNLPHALRCLGIEGDRLRTLLSGDIHLQGPLVPLQLGGELKVRGREFAVLKKGYLGLRGPAIIAQAAVTMDAKLQLQPDRLVLAEARLVARDNVWSINGALHPHDQAHFYDLHISCNALHLDQLGPIAGLPFAGITSLEGQLKGALRRPHITAFIAANNLRIGAVYLGKTRSGLSFDAPWLRLEDIKIEGDPGRAGHDALVLGRIDLGLGLTPPQVQASLEARHLDAPLVLESVGLPPAVANHFVARLDGQLRLHGVLRRPAGLVHLAAPRLALDDTEVGAVSLEATLGGPQKLHGLLRIQPPDGEIFGDLTLLDAGGMALHLRLDEAPMRLVSAWMPSAAWDGSLRGQVNLQTSTQGLHGAVQLHGSQMRAYGAALGSVDLNGSAQSNVLAWDAAVFDGALPLSGTLHVGAPWTYAWHGHAEGFEVGRLVHLGADTNLWIDATAAGDGDLLRATSHRLNLRVMHARVALAQLQATLQAPTTLSLVHQQVHLARSDWRGPLLALNLSGTLDLAPTLINAHLEAQGDVAAARSLLPAWLTAEGPFRLQMQVGGTFGDPLLAGELNLLNGAIAHVETQQKLTGIVARSTFTGRNMLLHPSRARLGGGTVEFFGEASRPAKGPPQLNLQADFQQVGLRLPPDLDATLSGDVNLLGPLDNLLLRGDIKLDAVRYTARLELNRLIPRSDRLPLRSGAPLSNRTLRLMLHMAAPNNILINSSVLEAELRADLTLTGTALRPGLLGNITPLWARARYRDNAFEVVRAAVDFTDEYRIFTEYSLQARTQACNMTADVTIAGSTDGYSITPAGQDERGRVDPQDVLACLQFGLRLRDFQGNQRAPAGYSDALPGSLDALWTVSGLDTKVKAILPIDVDELRLTSGWSSLSQRTTARVLVGKELTDNVMLKYSRSLDAYNDQAISLEYRLSRRAVMQGNWLSVRDVPIGDFGLDFRLHWDLR